MVIQTLLVNTIAANHTESAFSANVASVIEKLALGAAAYANDLICKHFHRQISSGFILCDKEPLETKSEENESQMILRTPEEQLKMLDIFNHFLAGVANLLNNFDDLSLEFDQNAKAKEEMVEQAIAFVQTTALNDAADSKLEIFNVILDTVIARNSENNKILLTGQLKKLIDANRSDCLSLRIRIHLIRVLLKLPVRR